jgi:hypothetical protein
MRSKIRELDAGLPLEVKTWTAELAFALCPSRMATARLGVLGLMAAVLAIVGVFGMAAYSVSQRLRELGIRMAVGARRGQVLQAALGRAVNLLAVGSVVGLVLGILSSRVLAFIVYQATPYDPLVLGGGRAGHAASGTAGHVDSSATRDVGQSMGVAARRVSALGDQHERLIQFGWDVTRRETPIACLVMGPERHTKKGSIGEGRRGLPFGVMFRAQRCGSGGGTVTTKLLVAVAGCGLGYGA